MKNKTKPRVGGNRMEIEFNVMVRKMLTELRRGINEHSKTFNKEIENIRRFQTEATLLRSTVTEIKNTLGGLNSRLNKVEKIISETKTGSHPNQSSKKRKMEKKGKTA